MVSGLIWGHHSCTSLQGWGEGGVAVGELESRVGWWGPGRNGKPWHALRGIVWVALLTCAVTKHVGSRQRAGLDSKPLVQRREPHLEWALPQLLCAPGQSMLFSGLAPFSSPAWARRSLRSLPPPVCSDVLGKWLWLPAPGPAGGGTVFAGGSLQLACGSRVLARGLGSWRVE